MELDLPGYAVGGLAVGEGHDEMLKVLDALVHQMPSDKPRYLMGVGYPQDLVESVACGTDMFACTLHHGKGRNPNPGRGTVSRGAVTPPNAFVLHSYGRYCNGNKFAGETDAFEALAHVRKYYPIDENRLVRRGFSLRGPACRHMAVTPPWASGKA